jgi:hypothetical protein
MLFASMLGFASATELAVTSKYITQPVPIECKLDPVGKTLAHKMCESAQLSYYSGRISDLLPEDLDDTGLLVKAYAPKLFLPSADIITLHNITPTLRMHSGHFQVYDIENAYSILTQTQNIVLPGSKTAKDVMKSFATINYAATSSIVSTFASEVRHSKEVPLPHAERIYRAMNEQHDLLTQHVEHQFKAIREDISNLQSSLRKNELALAEMLEMDNHRHSLRGIIEATPRRMVEHGVDQVVISAAKVFAKAIAGAFLV